MDNLSGKHLANQRGWTRFTGLQIEYNLIERTSERELLPMANSFDIGITAWSPFGGGMLTGKYDDKEIRLVSKNIKNSK